MNLKKFELICNANDCNTDVQMSGDERHIEIEAKRGFLFTGTDTHILSTHFYSNPSAAYDEAVKDLMENLPLKKCDIPDCDWCI